MQVLCAVNHLFQSDELEDELELPLFLRALCNAYPPRPIAPEKKNILKTF